MALTEAGRRKLSSSMKKRWANRRAERAERTVLSSSSQAKRNLTDSLVERRNAILSTGKAAKILIADAERERTIKHILDLAAHLDRSGQLQALGALTEQIRKIA